MASDSTAFRVIDRIASTPGLLDAVRAAHARARERFWELHGAPERLTIDVDATLITAHSEKEKAAGNYKGGYGFHPLQAYLDETREALGGLLRPGNAGSNTADDHMAVLDLALAQIPAAVHRGAGDPGARGFRRRDARAGRLLPRGRPALLGRLRADRAGPRRDPRDPRGRLGPGARPGRLRARERRGRRDHRQRRSVRLAGGLQADRPARAPAPRRATVASPTTTATASKRSSPTRPTRDIAVLECRHRQHAHVEDRIRDDKDTGLAKFPFKEFALNEVWLEIVMLAHDLLVWTQALVLDGELAKAEPKRLRYRLLHVAGRLAFSGRRAKLHLQDTWPWAAELLAAFQKLKTLAPASG